MSQERTSSFENLFRRHEAAVRSSIRRQLGRSLRRRVDSADVLQEVFVEALRLANEGKVDHGMAPRAFLAWILRIADHKVRYLARYHLKSSVRAVGRETPLTGGARSGGPHARGRSASGLALAAEEADRLHAALSRLPRRQREVIELVHFQELTVAEAAGRMGKTPNSTSVLLHRAIERLGAILKRGKD